MACARPSCARYAGSRSISFTAVWGAILSRRAGKALRQQEAHRVGSDSGRHQALAARRATVAVSWSVIAKASGTSNSAQRRRRNQTYTWKANLKLTFRFWAAVLTGSFLAEAARGAAEQTSFDSLGVSLARPAPHRRDITPMRSAFRARPRLISIQELE